MLALVICPKIFAVENTSPQPVQTAPAAKDDNLGARKLAPDKTTLIGTVIVSGKTAQFAAMEFSAAGAVSDPPNADLTKFETKKNAIEMHVNKCVFNPGANAITFTKVDVGTYNKLNDAIATKIKEKDAEINAVTAMISKITQYKAGEPSKPVGIIVDPIDPKPVRLRAAAVPSNPSSTAPITGGAGVTEKAPATVRTE